MLLILVFNYELNPPPSALGTGWGLKLCQALRLTNLYQEKLHFLHTKLYNMMTMLHQQIKNQIKEAMLAHDSDRLLVLRGLLSAFTNELVAKKHLPSEDLNDDDAMTVIIRQVKQRKDSIEQFTKGGRNDLAENELKELAILETYLPAQLSREEIKKVALKKKEELNITDKTKSGMLMGAIMKELKGKASGDEVKSIVEEMFCSTSSV